MTHQARRALALSVAVTLTLASAARQASAAVIIFKDGFYIVGTVKQPRDFVVDPGGVSFPIPGGFYYIDDGVRRVLFSPSQVQDVLKDDPKGAKGDLMELKRSGPREAGRDLNSAWKVEEVGEWNKKWQRPVIVSIRGRKIRITQMLTRMSPKQAKIDALLYNWIPHYFTLELGSDQVRTLLYRYYEDKKQLKDPEKRLNIPRFLYQTGWLDAAAKELEVFKTDFPKAKEEAKSFAEQLKKRGATIIAEGVVQANKVGQHAKVREDLERLDRLSGLLDPKINLQLAEIREKNRTAQENLKQTRAYLKSLPPHVLDLPFLKKAADDIAAEVSADSLERLEAFRDYARQYENETKQKREHSQSAEQVLALAITGWLQGNAVAEPDIKTAHMLWKARQTVLDLQKEDDAGKRKELANSLVKDGVAVDVLDRLIRHLPPPQPPEKLSAEPMLIQVPDGPAYVVQLPPEYHPHRSYPVLMLLHAAEDNARDMMLRYHQLAALHGYILAAPVLGKGIGIYQYTGPEQAVIVDTLRDLRRKFQVDSDRVFLHGWREGATIAWDVGLAFPDLFAGVLPFNGDPRFYPQRAWSNAQYLPIYAVEGDLNGGGIKAHKAMFKELISCRYPALFVEYKGRASEWFAAEGPIIFDWMNRKTRANPIRQLGLAHTGGSRGEEFKTHRDSSTRFYWLSTDHIVQRCRATLNDVKAGATIYPASLQGRIATGNELGVKAGGGVGNAKIWYQIDVRAYGVDQVTIWLGPKMIDFTKPVLLRINGTQIGKMHTVRTSIYTLLEDFYRRGDRQRLYYARIDRKL